MRAHRLLLACTLLLSACPDPLARPGGEPTGSTGSGRALPETRADTRFVKVRTLLEEPAGSRRRARELYPLVLPVCTSEEEREEFVEVATWSVSFSEEDFQLPRVLAADTLEHVATACMRNHPEAAFDLLDKAQAALPEMRRLAVVRARLAAASGDLAAAEAAARQAMEAGSVHAIALTANIQARRAREAGEGYRQGMLDAAIGTVSKAPEPSWQVIDLVAVLSTKARLLSEKALWQTGEAAEKTRLEAAGLYQRLSQAPFIEATRRRSLDVLCFEAMVAGADPLDACPRAAKHGILGAARATETGDLDPRRFEVKRLEAIEKLAQAIAGMPKGQVVVLVARGDELELLEWIRAASHLLERVEARDPKWVVVDRTDSARASALLDRLLALSGIEPALRVEAGGDTLAMPCVAAVLADRRTPKACPLDEATVERLSKLRPYAMSILVGRNLDAELDDLGLYDLRTVLLSFRQSQMEEHVDAWLKSLSDVGVVLGAELDGAKAK